MGDILRTLGYTLEEIQPHLSDEGVLLMRDKRVLVGRRTEDGKKVIIVAGYNAEDTTALAEKLASNEGITGELITL